MADYAPRAVSNSMLCCVNDAAMSRSRTAPSASEVVLDATYCGVWHYDLHFWHGDVPF